MSDKLKKKAQTFIIAEIGVNHNGCFETAKRLIEQAALAGADAVKFQTFKAEASLSVNARKADYQVKATGKGSQLDIIKKLELSFAEHKSLRDYTLENGLEYMSTAFDSESLAFNVNELKVSKLKIASGEITNAPLLLEHAKSGKELIISTGMCNLDDIKLALGVVAFGFLDAGIEPSPNAFLKAFNNPFGQKLLKQKVSLLHCTTEYPAPVEDINLNAMSLLKDVFELPVGYSDHSEGIIVPIAAVANNACIIEKHFTLDKTMEGPDHLASLEPDELKNMVKGIRIVEQAQGKRDKVVAPSELKNQDIARKSLVARIPIRRGEAFSSDNLTMKRPGNGLSPYHYWKVLGKQAKQDIAADELLAEEHFM